MTDRELKKIIRQWSESPEGVANRGALKLENAPQLQKLLHNTQNSSRLWELALDECQKFFRKERGVFYTPRAVTDLMVENALDAWFDEYGTSFKKVKKLKILDPSCGDGGFLISALKYLLTVYCKFQPGVPENELIKQIINNNLYGIDCDSNALDLLIKKLEDLAGCKVKTANFVNKNALDFSSAADCFDSSIKFDLVIGNPPYVSYGLRNVNKLDKERSAILHRRFPDSAEYKIALYALFMEFAVNSIKKGAYHSFIVPDSFLCGQYFTKLRNFLLKNCEFEKIWFIRQKIFKATPGALVVYLLRKAKNTNKDHILQTLAVDDIDKISEITPYYMLQNEFADNHRQRFRLFFDRQTHEFIRDLEHKSICKLGDLFTFASGVIGKKGKNSIVAADPDSSGCWKKGITSGKALHPGEPVKWQGEYINVDPRAVKSGIGKIDYDSDKILIRQTGDKIIAAVDYNKLVVLNNTHIAVGKVSSLDLECISEYLNSDFLRRYYQAVTLESGRAMAQVDLETLRELPVIKSAVRYKK